MTEGVVGPQYNDGLLIRYNCGRLVVDFYFLCHLYGCHPGNLQQCAFQVSVCPQGLQGRSCPLVSRIYYCLRYASCFPRCNP